MADYYEYALIGNAGVDNLTQGQLILFHNNASLSNLTEYYSRRMDSGVVSLSALPPSITLLT